MSDQDRTYPEPPDGSIVGWGHPIRQVRVRLDDFAESDVPHERWFLASDDDLEAPKDWAAVLASDGYEPYLLVEQPYSASPSTSEDNQS